MADHKKAIQNTEGERRDCEEVHRRNCLAMFLRNAIQCLAGSGFLRTLRTHRETVVSDTLKPSFSSSPWMRGAPQVGFSATMRKIKARISLLTRFRPPTRLALETHLQYSRKPARCQPTTVLGVTKMRGLLHPDHNPPQHHPEQLMYGG